MDKACSSPPSYEDAEKIPSFHHKTAGYEISLLLTDELVIKITNHHYIEESSINYDKSAKVFQGHTILSKPESLYKVLVEAFNGNNKNVSANCSFSHGNTTIKVNVETQFISDELTLIIPVHQKNGELLIDQLIIDKAHLEEQVDYLMEQVDHLEEQLSKDKADFEKKIEQLSNQLFNLTNLLSRVLDRTLGQWCLANYGRNHFRTIQKVVSDSDCNQQWSALSGKDQLDWIHRGMGGNPL